MSRKHASSLPVAQHGHTASSASSVSRGVAASGEVRAIPHPAAAIVATPPTPPPMHIYPGVGLGPFRLGSSIGCVLSYVQQHAMTFRSNDLLCSPSQPTQSDITLDLHDIGVRLRFDAHAQRLTLIDVYDHRRVPLLYMKALVTSQSGLPATFSQLYHLFGPTYPGTYDQDAQMYLLQYPGVCLAFRLPTSPEVSGDHGQHVLTLADGSSPPVDRLFIHFGRHVHAHNTAMPPIAATDTYFEPITVHLSRGLYFERRGVFIGFDSFAQDLLSDIGAPQNIFVKQADSDKMNIHKQASQSAHSTHYHSPNIASRHLSSPLASVGRPSTPDYIYNYQLSGFDALIDGVTHRVKKFILHTNFIDRPDFNQYAKCNFIIGGAAATTAASARSGLTALELPPTAVDQSTTDRSMLGRVGSSEALSSASGSPSASPPNSTAVHIVKAAEKDAFPTRIPLPPRPDQANAITNSMPLVSFSPSLSPSVLPQSHATVITPDSKWSDVLAVLGPCPSRPMVSSSHTAGGPSGGVGSGSSAYSAHMLENPFAATYFYAYQGAVFEVCKNHHLASVTLFRDE